MRPPRVRFTVRRMMILVALLAIGISVSQLVWRRWAEQRQIRNRIAIRQKLLRSIGGGNGAGHGVSGERGFRFPSQDWEAERPLLEQKLARPKAEADRIRAEMKEAARSSTPSSER